MGDDTPERAGPDDDHEAERHVLPDEVEYPERDRLEADRIPGSGLPPKAETWRRRSATGAMLTGFAFGLREVLEPERHEPAIVLETSGVPPKDLPVEADLENLPPRQSVVRIRRWLLTDGPEPDGARRGAGDPTGEDGTTDAALPFAGDDAHAEARPGRTTEIRSRKRQPRRIRRFGRSEGKRS